MKTLKEIYDPNRLSTILLYTSIISFIIAFNFSDNPPAGGWQQQFLPDLNGGSIVDMTFTDSLTGYAATTLDTSSNSYIIKTSNGGENWIKVLNDTGRSFSDIQFINNTTGYASTLYGNGTSKLFKTNDGGNNWVRLYSPGMFNEFLDISVVSDNEVWMADRNGFSGGIFRSTNGGVNWENKYPPQLSNGPTKIYMINSRIGFISNGNDSNKYIKKTTDSGDSWFLTSGGTGWNDIYFRDSLTGWRSIISLNNFKKTTDGGLTWKTILNASIGNPNVGIRNFDVVNDTIIWGVDFDNYILFPNNEYRGIILKTTNNGLNWGYQLPDTSIRALYYYINFSDSLNGWSYRNRLNGVHTITGGDTITNPITKISNANQILPKGFVLFQNYPNPFNPVTSLEFGITKFGFAKILIYDILGKEVAGIVNDNLNPGIYKFKLDGSNLASGVYFYSLLIDGEVLDTKKMVLLR